MEKRVRKEILDAGEFAGGAMATAGVSLLATPSLALPDKSYAVSASRSGPRLPEAAYRPASPWTSARGSRSSCPGRAPAMQRTPSRRSSSGRTS